MNTKQEKMEEALRAYEQWEGHLITTDKACIDEFESNVDVALSVVNATTKVTVND